MDQLTIVRIKDWVIAHDEASYTTLRKLGITPTRVKYDVFATVASLKLRPLKVKVQTLPFEKVWYGFLEQIAKRWSKIPSTKMTNTVNTLTFTTLHPGVKGEASATLEKINMVLERFSVRWGTMLHVTHSEQRGKLKLHVEFRHGAKAPVIAVSETHETAKPLVIEFGFMRVELLPEDSTVSGSSHLMRAVVKARTGSEYTTIYTTRFLKSEMALSKSALEHMLLCKIMQET